MFRYVTIFGMALAIHSFACNRDSSGESVQSADELPLALQGFSITKDAQGLLFSFADPSTGQLRTSQSMADIPDGARSNVVVFSRALQKGDLPASLMIVADLTAPGDGGAYPFRLVSRYAGENPGKVKGGKSSSPAPGSARVIVYKTDWCPHCRTAANWLKARQIPFVEKDVERDPGARAELLSQGRKQGLPEHLLSSVPILYVRGTLVLGFDESQVLSLLEK